MSQVSISDEVEALATTTVNAAWAVHRAQVITYLKLLNLPLALLINFNVPLIRDGIHRVLNLSLRHSDPTILPSSRPA